MSTLFLVDPSVIICPSNFPPSLRYSAKEGTEFVCTEEVRNMYENRNWSEILTSLFPVLFWTTRSNDVQRYSFRNLNMVSFFQCSNLIIF